MGIYSQIELENCLFETINNYYKHRCALPTHDFFNRMILYFDSDFNKFKAFLTPLYERGYIKFEGPACQVIKFGENAMEWRERLEKASNSNNQQIANQTFNIAHAQTVQAAGRDITITLTESDAENVVRILREIMAQPHEDSDLTTKVKNILGCGAAALEILKQIAALVV